jgi:hypothetical protein
MSKNKPREFCVEFIDGKPARLLDSSKYSNDNAVMFVEKSALTEAETVLKALIDGGGK